MDLSQILPFVQQNWVLIALLVLAAFNWDKISPHLGKVLNDEAAKGALGPLGVFLANFNADDKQLDAAVEKLAKELPEWAKKKLIAGLTPQSEVTQ